MVTLTTPVTPSPSTFPHIRMMSAKIAQLRSGVNASVQSDPLTLALKSICDIFTKNLRSSVSNPKAWEDALSLAVTDALKDDLLDLVYAQAMPLHEPLLGSDGYVYSKKTLALFYAEAPEEFLEVSPLTQDPDFYVEPHAAARCAIDWLKQHSVYPEEAPALASAYDDYRASPYFVPLPEELSLDVRHALLQNVLFIREQEKSLKALQDQVDSMEKIVEDVVDNLSKLDAASVAKHKELEQAIQEIIDNRKKKEEELELRLHSCEEKISSQLQLNDELEGRVDVLEQEIASEKEEIAALHKAIKEAEEALEELQERRESRFFTTFVFGAFQAMLFGTPFLLGVIRSAALSVIDDIRERLGIPKEFALVAGGMISGGWNASASKMTLAQGIGRGAVRGAVSVGAMHIAPHAPFVGDIIEGAADPLVMSKNPSMKGAITGMGLSVTSGGISRMTGVPVALSLTYGEDGKQKLQSTMVIK